MSSERRPLFSEGLRRVDRLRLGTTDMPWPLAISNAADIRCHFKRRQSENPAFYDGEVYVLREAWQCGPEVEGLFSLERFSSFLYWRDGLGSDAATLDGFGTALVRSSEGHVLAVRAASDTLNSGRIFLPGGFIDARDREPGGLIDIDRSIARELAEETGLKVDDLARVPGYIVGRRGRHCCFCVEFRSALGSRDLRELMLEGARRDKDGELADVVIVARRADLDSYDVLDHARLVIESVLSHRA
ncbi:MAG: NUDIX hydrolase [Hyphomicrobiaceae bacterium]